MSDTKSDGEDVPDSYTGRLDTRAPLPEASLALDSTSGPAGGQYDLERYDTQGVVQAFFLHNTFNRQDFQLNTRWAFQTDCQAIRNFLQTIGVSCIVEKENLSAQGMKEFFKELAAWEWNDTRLVVVAVAAYGEGGRAVLASDGGWVEVSQILQGLKCPALAGIPKLLLLNTQPVPDSVPATLRHAASEDGDPVLGGRDTVPGGQEREEGDTVADSQLLADGAHVAVPVLAPKTRRLRVPREADVLQIVSEVTSGAGRAGRQAQCNAFLTALLENVLMAEGKMEVCQILTRVNQQLGRALAQSAYILSTQSSPPPPPPPRRASFFVSTLTKELYLPLVQGQQS